MPRTEDSRIIPFPRIETQEATKDDTKTQEPTGPQAEIIDLFPCVTLIGPCPLMPSLMMHYTLTHGRLSVTWDMDELHRDHIDYETRAKALKIARGYASKVMTSTAYDRFLSLGQLVTTLSHYTLLPSWLRVL